MSRVLTFVLCAALLAGCGIKRPLMPPKDIPDYEDSLRRKHERIVQEQSDIDRANTDKVRDDAAKSVVTPAIQGTK